MSKEATKSKPWLIECFKYRIYGTIGKTLSKVKFARVYFWGLTVKLWLCETLRISKDFEIGVKVNLSSFEIKPSSTVWLNTNFGWVKRLSI